MPTEKLYQLIFGLVVICIAFAGRKIARRQKIKRIKRVAEELKQGYNKGSKTFTPSELLAIGTQQLANLKMALSQLDPKYGITADKIEEVLWKFRQDLPRAINIARQENIVRFEAGHLPLLPVIDSSWLPVGAQVCLVQKGNGDNEVFHMPPRNLIATPYGGHWAINVDSGRVLDEQWCVAGQLSNYTKRSGLTLEEVVAVLIQKGIQSSTAMMALNSVDPTSDVAFAIACQSKGEPPYITLSYGEAFEDPEHVFFPTCSKRV